MAPTIELERVEVLSQELPLSKERILTPRIKRGLAHTYIFDVK